MIPYAEKNGYGYYAGTPRWVPRGLQQVAPKTLGKVDLWFNMRWITSEMNNGWRIIDIGAPAGMPPSEFYNMELEQTSDYLNYSRDPQR